MEITDTIKSLSVIDRPREKIILNGSHSLTDSELIAILLGKGTKNKSALTLSRELLFSSENNLETLSKKSIFDIRKIKGIGDAKASVIAAALELGRRRQSCENSIKRLGSSKEIFDFISPLLSHLNHEEFWAIFMHKNHKIIEKRKVSSGGYDAILVDIRMILKYAIENNAVTIAVAHNHPSGNEMPSKSDRELTKRLKDACELFNIELVDHIIVASAKNYFSFFDNGFI
jgi:DNA repair protein RadC